MITKKFHIADPFDVMDQTCMFSARRAVHTLVEKGLRKKTTCRVFDGVQDALFLAHSPRGVARYHTAAWLQQLWQH